MSKTLQFKILLILAIAFSIFWTFAIGMDYINKHPIYFYGFKYFRFLGLTLGLLALGILFSMSEKMILPITFKIPINGLLLIFYGSILSYFIIKSNSENIAVASQSADYMHYVALVLKSTIQLLLIYGILMSFGAKLTHIFYKKGIDKSGLLDIAFGIMGLILILFILAALGFLNLYSLLITFLILAIVSFKNLIPAFKKLFWTRIDFSSFTFLGVISLYGIFIFLLINYISIQNPFPNGFDTRNYYANISSILSEGNGLVTGYAPYNWSIFMSIGLILFDQIELCLSISFSAFVLVLFTSYKIAVRQLSFDKSFSLFILLLVTITPALVNQLFVELKVDFGLLFYQMLIVYYLFNALPQLTSATKTDTSFKSTIISVLPSMALIGLLCGFGLGIKMINMFLLFSILTTLWWQKDNQFSVLCILSFTIALFLFAGIDELSGLRKYHLNVGILKWGSVLLFTVSLAYNLFKYKSATIKKIAYSAIFLCFTGLSFSPWISKNIIENKSLNPKTIMIGGSTGPSLNINSMTKKYKGSNK